MTYTPEQWTRIETLALKLGATSEAIRKWRIRGKVAATWHMKLVAADKKMLAALTERAS
jgi:uncharacterized protein (DUF2235 family)